MKYPGLVVCLFFLAMSGCMMRAVTTTTEDWYLLQSAKDGFSIRMPQEPEHDASKNIWSLHWYDTVSEVSYWDESEKPSHSSQIFNEHIDNTLKDHDWKLLNKKFSRYKGYPSCDCEISIGDNYVVYYRYVLVKDRCYILVWRGADMPFTSAVSNNFFDSLQFSK